jgi:hypothetical protein
MKTNWLLSALTLATIIPPAQANERIDIAKVLIGMGHQSATYACADGSLMQAVFEIRADLGPVVLVSQNGREVYRLPRYLKPSEYEINQAVLGVSYDSATAVQVFYRTPTQIESIELGYRVGSRTEVTHRCTVRSVTYAK